MSDGPALQETESWAPETPFLRDGGAGPAPGSRPSPQSFALETPFLSEFESDGSGGVRTPQAEAFSELMEQLHDEEFEEALVRVIDEASAISEGPAYEGEAPAQTRQRQERAANGYLEGIASAAEAMLERMADESERVDFGGMSSGALDEYLEQFAPSGEGQSPVAEQFLKKFFKKVKSGVSGAVALAKKGIAAVGKFMPINLLLKKVMVYVRPMLLRVLRVAVDKLPVSLRPLAKTLASKILGATEAEAEGEDPSGESTTVDPREIAAEFDTLMAGSIVGGEAFEQSVAMESMLEDREGDRDAIRELDRARAALADKLATMDEGEDPTPAVEQFVPVVLGALKIGISMFGRPRVVRAIAGYVAQLIQRYIGRDNALKLSSALVDAGLRMVTLEAEGGDPSRAATETLVSTIEETVSRVAQDLPAEAWESETVLEAYTRQAFEQSAAANFPDDTIKSELHEANEMKGLWMRRPGRYYKKYSRVPSILLPPQVSRAIPSFRGQPLGVILRDRFGITGPVRVNVHLYETVPGTTVGGIARGESESAQQGEAFTEEGFLHPLTEEAAGLLLREPGLGRSVDEAYLASPHKLAVGQRLYRVELADRSHAGRMTRARRLRIGIHLRRGEVKVLIFLSEAAAQEIARAFRRKAAPSIILNLLRRGFEAQVAPRSEAASDSLRVVGESLGEESEVTTRRVRRRLGRRLRAFVLGSLVRVLGADLERRYQQLAAEFDKAANANVDGITVRVTLRGAPWLAVVRRMAARGAPRREATESRPGTATTSHSIEVLPGYSK